MVFSSSSLSLSFAFYCYINFLFYISSNYAYTAYTPLILVKASLYIPINLLFRIYALAALSNVVLYADFI